MKYNADRFFVSRISKIANYISSYILEKYEPFIKRKTF